MDLIKEINEKYQALEAEIDKKLEKAQAEEQKLERQFEKLAEKTAIPSTKVLSYEEALQRNANTLKSLEIAKARLRSRSTYSPVEKLLQRALKNYKMELESLNINQSTENKCIYDGKSKQDEEDEQEQDNLYNLVMQNVFEANSKGNQVVESQRN